MHTSFRGVVAALLLIGTVTDAAAQQREFGALLGISGATLTRTGSDEGVEPFGWRMGISFGAFAQLPIRQRIALQIEALLVDKGGDEPLIDPIIVSGSVTARYKLRYLDVPVLVRIAGPRVGTGRIHAFAGPTVSLRTGATKQSVFEGEGAFGLERDLESDEIDRFDTGFTLGGGLQFQRLRFDARYTLGLADVLATEMGRKAANRSVLVTAGYRIF